MKAIHRLLLGLVSMVGLFVSGSAHAQSCSTYMQDKLSWVANGGGYYLNVTGTSLNAGSSSGLVSYVSGYVDQYSAGFYSYNPVTYQYVYVPAKVYGTSSGIQAFSDRFNGSQNFNVNQRDTLSLSFDENGNIVIRLVSWGNGTVSVTPTSCANNIISGFSSNGTLWAFSLYKAWLG